MPRARPAMRACMRIAIDAHGAWTRYADEDDPYEVVPRGRLRGPPPWRIPWATVPRMSHGVKSARGGQCN